jgi:hypothetical protein
MAGSGSLLPTLSCLNIDGRQNPYRVICLQVVATAVPAIEYPRAGGSIPPPATVSRSVALALTRLWRYGQQDVWVALLQFCYTRVRRDFVDAFSTG